MAGTPGRTFRGSSHPPGWTGGEAGGGGAGWGGVNPEIISGVGRKYGPGGGRSRKKPSRGPTPGSRSRLFSPARARSGMGGEGGRGSLSVGRPPPTRQNPSAVGPDIAGRLGPRTGGGGFGAAQAGWFFWDQRASLPRTSGSARVSGGEGHVGREGGKKKKTATRSDLGWTPEAREKHPSTGRVTLPGNRKAGPSCLGQPHPPGSGGGRDPFSNNSDPARKGKRGSWSSYRGAAVSGGMCHSDEKHGTPGADMGGFFYPGFIGGAGH